MDDNLEDRLSKLEKDFEAYKVSSVRPDHGTDEMDKFISEWFEKQLRPGGLLHK